MNNTPCESARRGLAFALQAVGNVAVNGATIATPWTYGRAIVFTILSGAMASTDALTITVQGRKKSDGSWVACKQSDGSTNLTFTVSKTSDAGELDKDVNGFLVGSLRLDRLKSNLTNDSFDALRLTAINAVSQNVSIAATYSIVELYIMPDKTNTDDLFSKQLAMVG